MAEKELDLEAEGLFGASYDSFFAIDKRVRKIQDLYVPTRQGLSVNQIVTFFLVLFFSFLFQVLILGQVMSLLGIPGHWLLFVTVVFGPPILCAWRVTKPMPSDKSIPGTVQSLFMYLLDDPVHRRGRPVKSDPRPQGEFVQHYLRDWTVSQEFTAEVPGEGDWTDDETESLFTRASGHVNLQEWMDRKAIDNHTADADAKSATTSKEITVHDRRGAAATVTEF